MGLSDGRKLALEQLLHLYTFYAESYIKGLFMFIVINGALITLNLDHREMALLPMVGLGWSVLSVFPIVYCRVQERDLRQELAAAAKDSTYRPFSTKPLLALWWCAVSAWSLCTAGWIYILATA